jgi:penicillin G amidase
MTRQTRGPLCALFLLAAASCRQPAAPPPLVAAMSGTIEVAGLAAPARIVRDKWGVPHISAGSQDDLFFAQGFTQAQDRLFQMDLWRRSVQGRLSQVLGANFIERDAMTRRVQYRGDAAEDWSSYGPDARAIAAAFVRGINAWVELARERPPEEFVLAGWKPEYWSANDLLNRTDAFLSSGDAIQEVRRANLSEVIAEAIGRIGAPPFFAGLAATVADAGTVPAQRNRALATSDTPDDRDLTRIAAQGRAAASRDAGVTLSETGRILTTPSPRYFIHLKAPGWNVIGATAPWLPGVALGHNEHIAWGMTPIAADTQDIYVEEGWAGGAGAAAGAATVIADAIVVKGRKTPFVFETAITPHGFVVAADRERDRAFTLRWSGSEAGAAAELGALALDRATSWTAFREALGRWRMPARHVVYADVEGNVGYQDAALVPRRRGREWTGWLTLDDLPHAFNPPGSRDAPPRASSGVDSPGPRVVFAHILGITNPARRRFNVGPVERPADDAPVRAFFDPRNWDRSHAISAPGQSESPASPHFADLAAAWATGGAFPLAFSDEAVAANAEATLTIVPKSDRLARP